MTKNFNYKLIQHGADYILLLGRGSADATQIEEMYQSVYEYASSSNVYRLLFDVREVELNYPMDHFVPLMKRLSPVLKKLKTARVIATDTLHQSMIETVSRNNELALKNFDCRTQALNWLLED